MVNQLFTDSIIEIKVDPAPHDITPADSVSILYKRPDGTTGEWVGEKYGDKIRYQTERADVPTAGGVGTWEMQACAIYGTERKRGKFCYMTLKAPIV